MGLQHYQLADFRKKTKEAFDNAEDGHPTFITRHNKRYELRLAPIQGYKAQDEAIKARAKAEYNSDKFDTDLRAQLEGGNTPIAGIDYPLQAFDPERTNIVEQMSDKVYAVDGRDPIAVVDLTTEAEQVPSTATNVHTGATKMLKNLRSYKAPTFDPDPMSVFEDVDELPAEKKFAAGADAPVEGNFDASSIPRYSTETLRRALKITRANLDAIDIDTQDPDEIERGAELAALISEIEGELGRRGVK